jgi:hypothetical protein
VHRASIEDERVSIGATSAAAYPDSWHLAGLTFAEAEHLHELLGETLQRARALGWPGGRSRCEMTGVVALQRAGWRLSATPPPPGDSPQRLTPSANETREGWYPGPYAEAGRR